MSEANDHYLDGRGYWDAVCQQKQCDRLVVAVIGPDGRAQCRDVPMMSDVRDGMHAQFSVAHAVI